ILSHGLRWWLTEWNKQHAVLKTPNVQWLMESTEGNKNFIPVAFNPNQADDSIWLGFGVSQKGLQSIRKYLAKGGEFRKEEDVARMYCIDSTLFQKMRPFLMFPRRVNQFDRPPSPFRQHDWAYHPTAMRVELNSADTIELRKLPAIGVSIARRIIQYRERLGGYHALHQLLEVYRMTTGKLDTIQPFLVIDPSLIRKISINQISAQELGHHPYISPSQARALIAFRDKHGPFRSPPDLLQCLAMDAETLKQLEPYLSFDGR
ncbi:MAG: ComEA family DNA-binding protein, partial [Flavobacteriales bacterium]